MSWQPTEGLMRAAVLVYDLEQAALAAHHPIVPILRFHMTEVIAKALDQALADGAERVSLDDALDKVVGASNGNGHAHDWPIVQVPATADPVGYDGILEAALFKLTPEDTSSDLETSLDNVVAMTRPREEVLNQEPKRKRGRPKGSKAKKAKPAKAAKAIKAASFEEPSEVEFVAPEPTVETAP